MRRRASGHDRVGAGLTSEQLLGSAGPGPEETECSIFVRSECPGPAAAELRRLMARGWQVVHQRNVIGCNGTLCILERVEAPAPPGATTAAPAFRVGHGMDGQWGLGPGDGRSSDGRPWR